MLLAYKLILPSGPCLKKVFQHHMSVWSRQPQVQIVYRIEKLKALRPQSQAVIRKVSLMRHILTGHLLPTENGPKVFVKHGKKSAADTPIQIPIVINGRDIFDDRKIIEAMDPSQHDQKICVARFALADANDVNDAVATASKDPDGWRKRPHNNAMKL